MGFKSVMKKVGKGALKVGKVAVPIALAATGVGIPAAIAASAALNAADTKASGGSWKQALVSGGIGAGTAAIPGAGGLGGSIGGNVAKAGTKSLITGLAKNAATNFATGAGTSLATGQGLKNSLKAGGTSALTNVGTSGGGAKDIAKQVGKNVAVGAGGQLAAKGLTKAGVPGAFAEQGGNVFSNYLGGKLNKQPAISGGVAPAGTGFGATARPGVGGIDLRMNVAPQSTGTTGGGGLNWGDAAKVGLGALATGIANKGGGTTGTTGAYNPNGAASTGQYAAPNTPANSNAPATGQPSSWSERWGPLIAQGAGVAAGMYAGKKATDMAQKRSPEEQAALEGTQGAAGQLGRYGGQAMQQGQQQLQAPGQYFQTLLSGNRAAMSQAIAGPAAQLTGNYRGAARALDQAGVRGAARDVAQADLNRDRVSKIASLTTGMQPYAAEQLTSMGQNQQQLGSGMLANSGSLYGSLLGQGFTNRKYARDEGEKTAKAIGGLARSAGETVFKPKPQAAPPATTQQKAPAGVATPPPSMPVSAPVQGGTAKAPPPTGYPSTNIPLPTFGTQKQVWAY